MTANLQVLEALYGFYDAYVGDDQFACREGCSRCCTPNVTITSLEAWYLLQSPLFLHDLSWPAVIQERAAGVLYRPTATINLIAACCLEHREPPEDEGEHVAAGACLLLDKSFRCRVYAHRPFACRAMASTMPCQPGGEAMIPPFLFTINLALHQIIEHIDREGVTGSLPEVLDWLMRQDGGASLLNNRALPGFLVPPDEVDQFDGFLNRLRKAVSEITDGNGIW